MSQKSLRKNVTKGVLAAAILGGSLMSPELPFSKSHSNSVQAATVTYTVTASSLIVRSGAGTNYARLGSLPKGTKVQGLEKLSNGWVKITYQGKTAYVSGQYLKAAAAPAASTSYYIVTADVLNIRSGAGTNYKLIGKFTEGSKVTVTQKLSNGWSKVSFSGKIGYVSSQYLKPYSSGSTASKRINVPLISQRPELPSGCEATALTMALNYYGIKVSKTTIANKLPRDTTKLVRNSNGSIKIWGDPDVGFVGTPFGNGYTINPGPLKRVLDSYRSGGVNLTGRSFSEVESYVLKGKPVLVWFTINYKMPNKRTWKTNAGKTINAPTPLHCITVTGVDANYVYFNDSEANKKDVKLSKSAFTSVYNAMGKKALVVN
ncbi:C39 family peptidase [Peribacillus kribbensis]|uniref:C39 family peptidase n=1 Tax=Peribacillus kribbensis TaxID=356658 RepID=UPI00040A4CFB|nr:C39 family peptidase [Peribacillus kribbensis]